MTRLKHRFFSRDATLFASHGADTIVRSIGNSTRTTSKPHKETHLWILPTGDKLLSLPQEANTLAFSPDNKILAATTHKQGIRLWSIDSGLEMFRIKTLISYEDKLILLTKWEIPGSVFFYPQRSGMSSHSTKLHPQTSILLMQSRFLLIVLLSLSNIIKVLTCVA